MSSFSGNVLSEDTALITEVPASQTAVAGRSLRQLAWRRLKKDKVAMAGGVVVVLLLLVAIFAPWICKLLGIPRPTLVRKFQKFKIEAGPGGAPGNGDGF